MIPTITRRAFAVLTASMLFGSRRPLLGAAVQEPLPAPALPGSVWAEQFERWLDAQAERALAAGARMRQLFVTADDVRRRADEVRREVLRGMGWLPDTRGPLHARITNSVARDGYRIDGLVFESLPGLFVTANLYVPAGGSQPFPAVLGTAGHSDVGKAADTYQPVWVNLARRGVMVLAYDPPAQGERFEDYDRQTRKARVGTGTRAHSHAGQQCLLTGTSIARYFACDGVRAIDYLLTRPDVDPRRIGVAGNSGGGTQAAWLAIVEPRLAVVDVSCYITSWSALWKGPGPQDMEQVLPGFLSSGLDFVDMITAVAPKPYLVSSAIRDFFPIDGARATVAEARRVYAALGAPQAIAHAETDATHGWSKPLREAAYAWFDRWWNGHRPTGRSLAALLRSNPSESPVTESPVTLEPAAQLEASPTGQVSTSFKARTIFDINADRARGLARARARVTPARLRAVLQIGDDDTQRSRSPHVVDRRAADNVNGLRAERLDVKAEDGGVALPALLIHPSTSPRGSVVVVGGPDGADPADRANAERAARLWTTRGYLTLVLHVRGAGALASTRAASGYASDYQLSARAWLLGTSVVSWQVRDILAGLSFLARELPGAPGAAATATAERVLHAEGLTAPAGLFAAALGSLSAAWIEQGLVSYQDLATTRHYTASSRLFVPGILEVTDLPEIMALAAPATIHLVRPVRADGRTIESKRELRDSLGGALPDNVRFDKTGLARVSG
jgi:dienelactone hydrolase